MIRERFGASPKCLLNCIPGEVLALGGAGRALPRVLPLAAAEVEVAGGGVADALLDLVEEVHGEDAAVPLAVVLELVGPVKVGDGGRALLEPRLGDVDVVAGLLPQRPDDVHVGVDDGVVRGPVGGQLLPAN